MVHNKYIKISNLLKVHYFAFALAKYFTTSTSFSCSANSCSIRYTTYVRYTCPRDV